MLVFMHCIFFPGSLGLNTMIHHHYKREYIEPGMSSPAEIHSMLCTLTLGLLWTTHCTWKSHCCLDSLPNCKCWKSAQPWWAPNCNCSPSWC